MKPARCKKAPLQVFLAEFLSSNKSRFCGNHVSKGCTLFRTIGSQATNGGEIPVRCGESRQVVLKIGKSRSAKRSRKENLSFGGETLTAPLLAASSVETALRLAPRHGSLEQPTSFLPTQGHPDGISVLIQIVRGTLGIHPRHMIRQDYI